MVIVFLVLVLFVVPAYVFDWDWTGFTSGTSQINIASIPGGGYKANIAQPGKTLWDWLGLLGTLAIPIVVGLGAAWFSAEQAKASDEENTDNQREAALQAFIDKMSELLLAHHLRNSQAPPPENGDPSKPEPNEVRNIGRVRTLTVLRTLDGDRKATVLQFLFESGLIDKGSPIISLSGADLTHANLINARLRNAELSKVDLTNANLRGADLLGANLAYSILRDLDLGETLLSAANLAGADLSGARLRKIGLTDANLITAKLVGANLGGADLSANPLYPSSAALLNGADLTGADFSDANLTGVNLNAATLNKTIMVRANLTAAFLMAAHVTDTDLTGAKLDGANLHNVLFRNTIMPDGTVHNGPAASPDPPVRQAE
jgi:uncharacterized protein YjbI with pentapeptide repeats